MARSVRSSGKAPGRRLRGFVLGGVRQGGRRWGRQRRGARRRGAPRRAAWTTVRSSGARSPSSKRRRAACQAQLQDVSGREAAGPRRPAGRRRRCRSSCRSLRRSTPCRGEPPARDGARHGAGRGRRTSTSSARPMDVSRKAMGRDVALVRAGATHVKVAARLSTGEVARRQLPGQGLGALVHPPLPRRFVVGAPHQHLGSGSVSASPAAPAG
jgi:hypothetical protein